MKARALAVMVVGLMGCGAVDGAACEAEAATQCQGTRVSYCERSSTGGLKWKAYECPSGCDALKTPSCDWAGVTAGAACPFLRATQATCPAEGKLMLCAEGTDGGVWAEIDCPLCRAGAKTSDALNCNSSGCRCQ